jgi:hypothetical protein
MQLALLLLLAAATGPGSLLTMSVACMPRRRAAGQLVELGYADARAAGEQIGALFSEAREGLQCPTG